MVARHRPDIPILSLTPSIRAHRLAAFTWGVSSVLTAMPSPAGELFDRIAAAAREAGLAAPGDRIVIASSFPFGRGAGHTNQLAVLVA